MNVDASGDFVNKPMTAFTGREILTEILGHLGVRSESAAILDQAICIPCLMLFNTSQFILRGKVDRPEAILAGYEHLTLIGQSGEQSEDVMFTVEYSIRSAQKAVYGLLGLNREPPPVHRGEFNPRVRRQAFFGFA